MTRAGIRACIGLGSNLDDPVRQVRSALDALGQLPFSHLMSRSRLYRSEPVGPPGQPQYVNAAAMLQTGLAADDLLAALQDIERQQGRVRDVRWGPRTIDLDLLLYGDAVITGPTLTVPHPRLHERAFVLRPLLDIAPALEIPGLGGARAMLARLGQNGVEPLDHEAHAR